MELKEAVINCDYELTKLLLEYGANIHVNNDEPIITAVENGDEEMIKLLISSGANLSARGEKALQIALIEKKECKNIIKLLEHAKQSKKRKNLKIKKQFSPKLQISPTIKRTTKTKLTPVAAAGSPKFRKKSVHVLKSPRFF